MPPKFVREEEQVKRFQKIGDKIRRKACRYDNEKVPGYGNRDYAVSFDRPAANWRH